MSKKFMMAVSVSVIALMGAAPASAADGASATTQSVETNIEQGWETTKETVSGAVENIEDAGQRTYQTITSRLDDNNGADIWAEPEYINPRNTAEGMIGQPVYNADGEEIASVDDIIIDGDGRAQLIVLSSGDFGLGRKVAFRYDSVVQANEDGDLLAPVTEEMIESAPEYDFDRDRGVNAPGVTSVNAISVSRLLDGELIGDNGDTVADVDNITFRDGKAESIVVSHGEILGMGGDKVALNFDDALMMRRGSDVDFRLDASQTAQFQSYVGNERRYR